MYSKYTTIRDCSDTFAHSIMVMLLHWDLQNIVLVVLTEIVPIPGCFPDGRFFSNLIIRFLSLKDAPSFLPCFRQMRDNLALHTVVGVRCFFCYFFKK